jgi:predicted Zn-dependent protease
MFGENPREGVLRGNAFLHPELRFRLEFPAGWRVQNSPQQVVAQEPGGAGFVFLQLVQPQGRTLQEVAVNDLGRSGLQFVDGQDTRINGLPAFVGTLQGQMQQMGDVVMRSAWIGHDNQVFRVAGLVPTSAYRQVQRVVDASVRSFQPLSAVEAARIRPTVLALYTVQQGDTWDSIATGPGRNLVPAATLAVINGVALQERPQAGDRLKIVVDAR